MTMASFFGLTSIVPASGDPTSAVMSYSVTQSGSIYTYTVDLTNTSPSGFYINSFLFGAQYGISPPIVGPLADIVVVSIPTGWDFCSPASETYNFLICQGPSYSGTFPV